MLAHSKLTQFNTQDSSQQRRKHGCISGRAVIRLFLSAPLNISTLLLLCEWIIHFSSTCPSLLHCPLEDNWLHRATLAPQRLPPLPSSWAQQPHISTRCFLESAVTDPRGQARCPPCSCQLKHQLMIMSGSTHLPKIISVGTQPPPPSALASVTPWMHKGKTYTQLYLSHSLWPLPLLCFPQAHTHMHTH